MAIYSNFDGTMRNKISIGKNGPGISKVGTDDGVSIVKADGTTLGTVSVGVPTSGDHAVNKTTFDAKFGTTGPKIRTNDESDAIYVKLADKNKNTAGGYVALGADGKIESQFMPTIDTGSQVIVVKNKYGRNIVTGLKSGDSCIITPSLPFDQNHVYQKNDVVRLIDGGIMKFYSALANDTVTRFDANLWLVTTIEAGETYPVGTKLLYNGSLYSVITNPYTAPNPVVNPLTVPASLQPHSDTAIPDWTGGVSYAKGFIVKRISSGATTFYAAANAIPAMPSTQWTGNTVESKTYAVGDELLHSNKNYMVQTAYTVTSTTFDPSTRVEFVEDIGPDAGYFLLRRTPSPTAYTTDADWVPVNSATSVDSFNTRTGPVSSQTGDYDSTQIVVKSPFYGDLTGSTVQTNLQLLSDTRVKKAGDTMTGPLVMSSGSVTAPSLTIPTSTKSGIFDDAGKLGFSIEGSKKMSIGASGAKFETNIDMSSKLITKLATPQAASDAANKAYVDAQPLVLSGATAPADTAGKDGDVYMTVLGQGSIALPSADQWSDVATDGVVVMTVNTNSVPTCAVTLNNGLTWTQNPMPLASSSSSDQFTNLVSNNSDCFVAVRRMTDGTKATGKIAYTMDRGRTWNSASTFPGAAGAYFTSAVYSDGTPYMVFPSAATGKAYSSSTGDVWTEVLVPQKTWACSAGARSCYVAIEKNTAAGSNYAVFQVFGGDWTATTMASSLVWNSVATSDGVNYVAVGEAISSGDTDVVNYSNNRGQTWVQAKLPSRGRWMAVATNGTTFVATRHMSDKAAISTDYGKTWSEITLPAARTWTRLASSSRMYMALHTGDKSSSPVAVSVDGGRTWTSDINGQIADISFKNGGKWLAYAGSNATGANSPSTSTLYVRRDGDKMTGSLVIMQDSSKESIIASGAITASSLRASKYATNDATPKSVGTTFVGANNADAVDVGCAYGYSNVVEGNNSGFTLTTKAFIRADKDGVTEIPVATLTKNSLNINGSVGLGVGTDKKPVVYQNAMLAMDVSTKKHGIVIYNSDTESIANTEALSIGCSTKTISNYAIKVHSGMTSDISRDETSPLSSGNYVFGVTTSGVVDIGEALCVGTGRSKTNQPVANLGVKMTDAYACGIELSGTAAAKEAAFRIKGPAAGLLPSGYKHVDIQENGTSVLALDGSRLTVNKPVTLNAASSKNISLYIGGNDAFRMPCGTDGQRPATANAEVGMMRYNTTGKSYEAYNGTAWQKIQVGASSLSFQPQDPWKKLATPTEEGHTHSYSNGSGLEPFNGVVISRPPFVQFQSELPSGRFKAVSYDYDVWDGDYSITVYARFESDADAANDKFRMFISW